MSNQTPDRSHASGTFVPVVALPFTTPIVNSNSIKSFVRNSVGNYTVGLVNGLAFGEGNAEAALPANFLGVAGATIAPDGLSVLVTVFNLSGVPVDPPTFGLEVRSIEEGEGQGPQPALPAPPITPPGGDSLLLGWAKIASSGNLIAESSAGLITQPIDHPAPGIFNVATNTGGLVSAHMATILAGGSFFIGTNGGGPSDGPFQVTIHNPAEVLTDENFTMTFYRAA